MYMYYYIYFNFLKTQFKHDIKYARAPGDILHSPNIQYDCTTWREGESNELYLGRVDSVVTELR